MKVVKLVALLCLFSMCSTSFADEELEIIIDRGIENSLPIAILPFGLPTH